MKTRLRPFLFTVVGPLLFALASASLLSAQDTPNRSNVPEGVTAHRDLPYVTNGHERQVLDLYLPKEGAGPFPLVIWIHGGAWKAGNKDGCPPLRGGYVQQGYAVASLNYRLSQHAIFPAQIEDCKAAIRWLRAHAAEYGIDPDHFGVIGSSAGGHLSALVGTSGDVAKFDVGENLDQSSRVQAVGDYYGPTDFVQMDANALKGTRLIHDEPQSPESLVIGGPIQAPENAAKVQAANPVAYVTKDDPPFVIVHGDQDPAVPHHQSELLHAKLVAIGVPSHFITVHGGGHGQGFPGPLLDPQVMAFFNRHLRGDMTAADWPAVKISSVDAVEEAPRPSRGNANAAAGPNRSGPPTWDVIRSRSDRNHDGKVSKDEFDGPAQLFSRLDADSDGYLTEAEHNAFVARARRN
jgi:acetyl esterase/lipase